MTTRLITSPAAGGKTQYCIEEILSTARKMPLARIRVIVPDRLQAAYFRRRLSASGGSIGVYVGTFNDLYEHILEKAGKYIPVASNALLHRVIQDVVDSVPLKHYAPLRNQPGFILALQDAFAELKRALTYPETFLDLSKDKAPAFQELAQLYATYQSSLIQLGWADYEGVSWLAAAALEDQPALMEGAMQLLVVDGFDSFIGTQRKVLKLLQGSTNVLATLPGSAQSARTAYRRFTRTLSILTQELSPQGSEIKTEPRLPEDLLHVESKLFEIGAPVRSEAARLFLHELRSPAEEAREALRWIKAAILRDRIPIQDCAVFAPNLDQYQPYLRSAAREFGIPVHFTHNRPLTGSPIIAALLHLLDLSAKNFSTRELFKVLRSPYFSSGLSLAEVDLLEKVSRLTRVVEGREQWEEAWLQLAPSADEQNPDLDDELALGDLPRGADARALQHGLNEFFVKITPPEGTRTQTDWTRWLEDLLADLRFHENAKNEEEESALEQFRDALRALVMSESLTAPRYVDYGQYFSDLQNTLAGSTLPEPNPAQASVLIGSIREARGLRFQYVAVLGLSEGIFPAVERSDPFLPEALREELNLDSRLEREQASLFYQAVTRSDKQLLLTRPYLSDDGERWESSPYWDSVLVLFESNNVLRTIRPDDLRPLADAASSQELLFWAVRRKSLPPSYSNLIERWQQLQHAGQVIKARRLKRAVGPHEGMLTNLQGILGQRFSTDKVWSASRLESYSTCPHMFFVTNALELEPVAVPSLGLDSAQMGSILHKVMEEAYQTASDPANAESVLERLPIVAREIFSTAGQEYGFRPSELWELEQEQYLEQLEITIRELSIASEGWVPLAYEQTFGIQDSPPLRIKINDSTLQLRGVIDRIDKDDDGNLRVVDSKTGSSHLSREDLTTGRRLQLPLYALAAQDALGLGTPTEGIYWKILQAEAGSLKLSTYETEEGSGVNVAIETAKKHVERIVRGIRSGDFPPVPPKGGCPEYCPAAQWCWRYESGGWG